MKTQFQRGGSTPIFNILFLIVLFLGFSQIQETLGKDFNERASSSTICQKENIPRGDTLKMSVLLNDIHALASYNEQIIESINKKKEANEKIKYYQYRVQFNNTLRNFVVGAVLEEKPASMIIDTWTWPNQGSRGALNANRNSNTQALRKRNFLIPVKDYFNDKLDLKCSRFSDLQRLNVKMLQVAEKFELFGEGSEKAREELEKWRQNFEVVKSGLEQIDLALSNRKNKVEQVQVRINHMNQLLHQDILKIEDVFFQSQPKNFAVGRVTSTYEGYRLLSHSELQSPVVQQKMLKEYKEKEGFPLLEEFKAETAFHTGTHWLKIGNDDDYLVDGSYVSSSLSNPCKLKGHSSGRSFEEAKARLIIAEVSLSADSSYPALFCQE